MYIKTFFINPSQQFSFFITRSCHQKVIIAALNFGKGSQSHEIVVDFSSRPEDIQSPDGKGQPEVAARVNFLLHETQSTQNRSRSQGKGVFSCGILQNYQVSLLTLN